jgi:hypothetical protein
VSLARTDSWNEYRRGRLEPAGRPHVGGRSSSTPYFWPSSIMFSRFGGNGPLLLSIILVGYTVVVGVRL